MKLRCWLGMHGPYWNSDSAFMGKYSKRTITDDGFERECPLCGTRWQGSVIDRHVGDGVYVMGFGPWTRIKK